MPSPRRRGASAAPCALLAVGLLSGAAPLAGQDHPPLAVEGRVGAALPVSAFRTGTDRGGEIRRAPSFGLHFVYRGPSGWGPYVGFSQHRFDCEADGCPGGEYVATTWDLGMQRTLGQSSRAWLRAGLLFGRMEREVAPGPGGAERARVVSLLALGAEGGAGVRVPLRGRLALTPGVRAGWMNTQFRDGPLARVRWVTADLGVALGF